MKSKINTEYIFLFSIAFLCISFILIFIIFIFREKYTNELSNEFIADRITNTLIDAHNNNKLRETIDSNKNILGFGIYNPEGYPIIIFGSAPEKLNRVIFLDSRGFKRNKDNNSIIYVTSIRPQPHIQMRFKNRMHDMMMGPPREVSYLELKSPSFFKRRMLFNTFSFFIPILFILLTISFIMLYNKNLKYKKTLDKQKEMVKLGEISRTLAHEIKNPLSAMRIQTGYLQKVLPERFKNDLNPINEDIERLRLLTDRIGDLLRNPLGNPTKIDIIDYINNITKKFDTKINFLYSDNQKLFINFDIERLRSIFENVIINSIESIEEQKNGQGGHAKIEINISFNKENVCIFILDNGVGLAPDYNNKIFDPYYTTKTKGTGLGLSITKRFLEAGGGEIEIQPRENNEGAQSLCGTEVKIKIPLLKSKETS